MENEAGTTRGQIVSLDARPQPIEIDPANTAILVVDMQNDFGSKGGLFERNGIDISAIQRAVEPTAKVLNAGREAEIKIVYLKMGFKADLSDLGNADSPNRVRHLFFGVGTGVTAPNGEKSRVLVRDTWNTDILPELAPKQDDIVLYKHRFSGFFETELDAVLKQLGVKYLIVTGCTTSVCVESTIRDAMFRDYSSVLLEDCTAEPIGQNFERSNHDASLLLIQTMLGWISNSDEFVRAVKNEASARIQKRADRMPA
jgi:ureidoacrylate peracid hydrolase